MNLKYPLGAGVAIWGRYTGTFLVSWPAQPRLITMSGKYIVRTFGCQMNEHDSERLAGLLEADGLEPTTDVEQADVVVLNT